MRDTKTMVELEGLDDDALVIVAPAAVKALVTYPSVLVLEDEDEDEDDATLILLGSQDEIVVRGSPREIREKLGL